MSGPEPSHIRLVLLLLLLLPVGLVLLELFKWKRYSSLNRDLDFRLVWFTTVRAARSHHILYLIASVFAIVTALAGSFISSTVEELLICAFMGGMGLGVLLELCLPPGVLLLGGSNSGTARLSHLVNNASPLLRSVCMLDDFSLGVWDSDTLPSDNIRGNQISESWLSHVLKIIEVVLLIIVDVRGDSRPTLVELTYLARSPHRHKVVVFGKPPDLSMRLRLEEGRFCHASTERELWNLVKQVTTSRSALSSFYRMS